MSLLWWLKMNLIFDISFLVVFVALLLKNRKFSKQLKNHNKLIDEQSKIIENNKNQLDLIIKMSPHYRRVLKNNKQ